MNIKKLSAAVMLCSLALNSQSIFSDEIDETSSSAFIMLGRDDISNNSLILGTDIELKDHQHIALTFSQDQDENKKNIAKRSAISFSTNPYDSFSIETGIDSSKQTSDLTILNRDYVLTMQTMSIDSMANINWQDWQFGAGAKLINIETYYSEDNKINMHANGIKAEVSYYGFDNYFLGASYYTSNASDVPFKSLIDRLTLSTSQLQSIIRQSIAYALITTSPSIEASSISFSAGRSFTRGSIYYSFIKSQSIEIFNESLSSTAHIISGSINITDDLDLDLLFTQQNDSENNTVHGLNLGLTYSW